MNIVLNLFFCILRMAYYTVGWLRASLLGVKLGAGARISPRAVLQKPSYLGNVHIASGVTIGKGTYINSGLVFSGNIGKWCSIAYNVLIGPKEHRTDYWTTSPYEAVASGGLASDTERCAVPPVIEDGVWIGANVVVLRGVHIGERAVIAAGAVVTKNVPRGEIWGGVPARKLRERSDSLP